MPVETAEEELTDIKGLAGGICLQALLLSLSGKLLIERRTRLLPLPPQRWRRTLLRRLHQTNR
jgi:hypothetical protein